MRMLNWFDMEMLFFKSRFQCDLMKWNVFAFVLNDNSMCGHTNRFLALNNKMWKETMIKLISRLHHCICISTIWKGVSLNRQNGHDSFFTLLSQQVYAPNSYGMHVLVHSFIIRWWQIVARRVTYWTIISTGFVLANR